MAWFLRLKNLLRRLSQRRKCLEITFSQSDPQEQQKASSEQEEEVSKDLVTRGLLAVNELLAAEKEIRFSQRSRFLMSILVCKMAKT